MPVTLIFTPTTNNSTRLCLVVAHSEFCFLSETCPAQLFFLLAPGKDEEEELTAFSTSFREIFEGSSNHEPLSLSARFFLFAFKNQFLFSSWVLA